MMNFRSSQPQTKSGTKSLRLFPVVMYAAAGLLLIKVAHIAFSPDLDGLTVSQAFAQETETKASDAEPPKDTDEEKTADATNEKDEAAKDGEEEDAKSQADIGNSRKDLITTTEIEVLERLAERRKMLDRKETDLKLRENLLKAAEKRIEGKLEDIRKIEARIEKSFGDGNKRKAERFKDLVSMYENMKPKDAARIFNTLDLDVLLSVVQNMNARKMAGILAKMDPQAAQRLTVELAAIASGSMKTNSSELPLVTDNGAS